MDKVREMGKASVSSRPSTPEVGQVNITIKGNLQCIMVFAPKDMPGVSICRHTEESEPEKQRESQNV
jgi:hypothetical protein